MRGNVLIRRIVFIVACLVLAVIVFSTLSPLDLRPKLGTFVNVERFGAYAALGVLFTVAYPRRWLMILIAVICLSVGLEYGQMLVSSRHARWSDFGVKMMGGVAGVLFARLLLSRCKSLERFFLG